MANYAETQIASKGVDSLLSADSSTLSKVVSALKPSDFKNITLEKKYDGVLNLVAAASSSKSQTNVQVFEFYLI